MSKIKQKTQRDTQTTVANTLHKQFAGKWKILKDSSEVTSEVPKDEAGVCDVT